MARPTEGWNQQEVDLLQAAILEQPIIVPQLGDPSFGVPFCSLPGMASGAVPQELKLVGQGGEPADDRTLVHENEFTPDETSELVTTLSKRLQTHGGDDLFVVGDGETPGNSRVLALFKASKEV